MPSELSFEDAFISGVEKPQGTSSISFPPAGPLPPVPIVPAHVEESIKRDQLNRRDADLRRRVYMSPEELRADAAFDQTPGNLKELDDQIQRYSTNPKDAKKLKILQDERIRLRSVGQRSAADIDPGGMGGGEEDLPPPIQAPDGTGLSYDKDKGEFVQKSPKPMQRVLSFEEAARGTQLTSQGQPIEKVTPSGEKKFGPLDYGIAYAKGIGTEYGAALDIIAAIPGMVPALLTNIHTSVRADKEGYSQEIARRAGREASAAFPEDLANTSQGGKVLSSLLYNPVYNALKLIGQEDQYEGTLGVKAMGAISTAVVRAGDWLETKTNGAITTEFFQNLADTLMVGAAARGGKIGADVLKDKIERSKAAKEAEIQKVHQEDPLPVEQGPQITAQEQINQMLNIKSIPEREKYDAQRKKEVRAAFKKDPDYANYLDSLATQRVERHDAWTQEAEKADAMQRRMEEREAMRTSMPPNVDVPLDGPKIHYPEYTFDDVLRIMQKPAEGRDAGDLLTLKLWNRQAGKASLENILWAGTAVGAGLVGAKIYLNYQNTGFMFPSLQKREERLDEGEPRPTENGTFLANGTKDFDKLLPLALAAGWIKGKGGMWHPEAVERLAKSIEPARYDAMQDPNYQGRRPRTAEDQADFERRAEAREPRITWSERAVKNYLNKYAGTEGDPLKDVEISFGVGTKSWGDIMDSQINKFPAKDINSAAKEGEQAFDLIKGARRDDGQIPPGARDIGAYGGSAITSYLSHVGDYLRQNVDPAKLQQYDLVRAVKETAANDARVAKEMDKASAASTKDLPVYKEYPDGMKWVELKLPEKLTEEQAKRVRPLTSKEMRETARDYASREDLDAPHVLSDMVAARRQGEGPHIALGADGKPIKNTYTNEMAVGASAREAHLAGQLAQEGNQMGHCVGGYCEEVASGESKIYSLRDKKGKSHVTIEVEPNEINGKLVDNGYGGRGNASNMDDILQIKGKQNRAPVAEYLPYVQDFVKSGKWGEVRDSQNTGLSRFEVKQSLSHPQFGAMARKLQELYPGRDHLFTMDELDKGAKLSGSENFWRTGVHEGFRPDADFPDGNRGPRNQQGSIDPRLLASLAAAGIGITAGIALDPKNKIEGAILGALGGLALAKLSPKGVVDVVKAVWKPDTRIRINELANSLDTKILRGARATMQLHESMNDLKLSEKSIVETTHAVEAGDLSKLTIQQKKLAALAIDNFKQMGEVALARGVLKSAIDNYVTHMWKFGDQTRDRLMEAFGRRPGASMSPETKYALARKVPTLAEGKAQGLTPLTENLITITGIYNAAITRALANQEFLSALRNQVDQTTGSRLIMPASTAPKGYVHIDHPQLLGKLVHPDIASSMRFMFDTTDPGAMVRGAVAINQITKRMAVSFSMFHAKALLDAFTGAAAMNKKLMVGGAAAGAALGAVTDDKLLTKAMIGAGIGMMLPGMKHVAQAAAPKIFGENKYVRMIREGKEGDLVDHAMRDGLTFQIKRGKSVDEDVGHFYEGMKDIQKGLDSLVPHLGTPIKAFTAVNHAVDGFMWERLHAGMKLSIYAEKKAQLLENNEKAHQRDPVKAPRMSEERLGEEAAKFTNDIFGGINWRRAAEEARTKWGRDMALAVYSPTGRMINQLLLFAPDWTLSTTRAALRAFGELAGYGEGSGLKGWLNPKNATDLSRQYILRSALYYATIGDGINYALSGHHIWDNKDWTTIDMGDGRRMQWSKHTMEPVHWLTKPGQQALNKLGYVPREAANQLMGSEYLSTSGHAPRMNTSLGGRAFHAAKGFSPIAVQQSFDAGAGSGIAGFLGAPIYGVTDKQKMENRELKKFRRAMEGLKK